MPVLIAMCGLPFSGKSVLAEALSRELRIRLLSYDHGIYPVHSRSAPASSVAAEYDFVQAIARREIGAILAGGESLIYDDLLLQRERPQEARRRRGGALGRPRARLPRHPAAGH